MITNERLAELQREAEIGTLTTGGGRGISGKEVIELITAYREHRAALASGPGGEAFLGGMLGSFAGSMLDRKLQEFTPKQCAATREGRRCTLPPGHTTRHSYVLQPPFVDRGRGATARKGSSRT
jgi:hypothetical protein